MSASHPVTTPVNATAIPTELKARRQWIGWRWIRVDDRWTKQPTNPHDGKKARTNAPATWGTLEQAVAAMKRFRLDGVGFVFSDVDDFFGLDFDDAISPDGEISKPALAAMERFPDIYWEKSVSGTGLHGIGRARETPHDGTGNKRGQIEAYWRGRFFVMTGNAIPGYDARDGISDATETLAAWHAEAFPPKTRPAATPITAPKLTLADDEVLERARRMAGFPPLFEHGDLSTYEGDHSRADLGMLNHLVAAGATDPDQLDRLYRASALVRAKWDKKHHSDGRTYGQGTIDRALNGAVQPFDRWSTKPIETSVRQAAATGESNPTEPILEGAGCEVQLAIAHRQIQELETQLAAARADNTALVHLITNTDLKPVEVRAAVTVATEALAKRDRGEVDDDGRVRLSSGEISRDYRPKPPPGERLAPTNTDGTVPRLPRANVRPVVELAIDRGLIEATPIKVERSHPSGSSYTDTEWAIVPPASMADALKPWAQWHPEEPKARKPRTIPTACPECGEVHAIRRTDSCTGCGAIVTDRIIEPVTEAPTETGDNLSPVKSPAPPSVVTRIGRPFISGPPATARSIAGDKTSPLVGDPSCLPGFEPTPLDRYTDITIGVRK